MATDSPVIPNKNITRSQTCESQALKNMKKEGDSLIEYFEKFFQNLILVSTLGAGFGFSILLSPDKPISENSYFSASVVNDLVALSWLFFVTALALCAGFSSALNFHKEHISGKLENHSKFWHVTCSLLTTLIQTLVLAGFLTASLAVSAYSKHIGYAAVSITAGATIALTLASIIQMISALRESKK